MQNSSQPKLLPIPFATGGSKQDIPNDSQIGITAGRASYTDGFPPLTRTPLAAGGIPPFGTDFNGVFNDITAAIRWSQAGAGYSFNTDFSSAVAGYPKGARIPNSSFDGFWLNTVDGNNTNPENTTSSLTGWVPQSCYGVTNITGLSGSSVVLTTLQASKDRLIFSGTLSANINIVVPAWIKKWEVVNNTTGAYSITLKTPNGSGVAIPSGSNAILQGDGTNITQGVMPGSLLNVATFLASGSYTPKVGARLIRVKAVAGGGASGSEPATSTGNGGMSQGGYYGQYIDVLIPVSSFTSPVSIAIGSGGVPSAAGQNAGGTGGATSFGSLFTLPGGPGGVSMPLSTGSSAAGASLSSRPITSAITPINSSGGITKASTVIQVVPGTNLGQMPLPSPIEGGYYGSGGIGTPAQTTAVQGNPGISGLMIIEEYA